MIAGGFGSCSTLVHLIAQHPKVAMMIGVVGTVVYLSGPAGPGYRAGNEKSINVLSEQAQASGEEEAQIRAAFNAVWNDYAQVSDNAVKKMIKRCGCDMNVTTVQSDKMLLRDTAFLYFLDLAHANGIIQAQQTLKSELATGEGASTSTPNEL